MKTQNTLNAQELYDSINIAKICGKDLNKITIDFSYYGTLFFLRCIAEDLFDQGNKKIESIILVTDPSDDGEKDQPLTAQEVSIFLEYVSTNREAYGGKLSDVTINYRANYDDDVYPFTNNPINVDLKGNSIALIMSHPEYVASVKVNEKKWDALYNLVDEWMVEGDEGARDIIENKGYSVSYAELVDFLGEKISYKVMNDLIK